MRCRDDHLGAATQRPVDGVDQPRVARVVAGDQHDIQGPDPRREGGGGHDGEAGAVAERGDEQSRRTRGAPGTGDQYHAAWSQIGQAGKRVLTDGRRGGAHLGAAGSGRAQGAAGIGCFE